jgi:hypothetical protein
MTDHSDRMALPFLSAGQAQKELYHNEALTIIDLLTHAAVEDHGLDTPPSSPAPGQCWIVGASPSGAWTGHALALAGWTSGGWRFVAARAGMAVWDLANEYRLCFDGVDWIEGLVSCTGVTIGGLQVVGSRSAAIADPIGGSVIDVEGRTAIDFILDALRTHGLIAS